MAGAAADVQLLYRRRHIHQAQRRNHVEDPALAGFIAWRRTGRVRELPHA